jgi:5-methyltetrahydrofolate--homocysteine methyltransferase
MAKLENLMESIMEGDESKVKKIVEEAVKDKVPVKDILNEGLIGAMNIVGVKFRNCELFVPEVLMAARAMKAGIDILKPLFDKSGVQPLGKIVIGTVKGDLHDIGKNLVAMMVEGSGFEVLDLGVDVPPEKFVNAVKANSADLCMMSALLTTTMPVMKETVEAFKEAGLGEEVKTMVGGAPVTQNFANTIGADGYGSNAAAAVEVAKALIGKRS